MLQSLCLISVLPLVQYGRVAGSLEFTQQCSMRGCLCPRNVVFKNLQPKSVRASKIAPGRGDKLQPSLHVGISRVFQSFSLHIWSVLPGVVWPCCSLQYVELHLLKHSLEHCMFEAVMTKTLVSSSSSSEHLVAQCLNVSHCESQCASEVAFEDSTM